MGELLDLPKPMVKLGVVHPMCASCSMVSNIDPHPDPAPSSQVTLILTDPWLTLPLSPTLKSIRSKVTLVPNPLALIRHLNLALIRHLFHWLLLNQ